MKCWKCSSLFIRLALFSGHVFAQDDVTLSATQLRPRCVVKLHKTYAPSVGADVNGKVFDMHILWKCMGEKPANVGTIGAEGSGPEIVTVFYRTNEIVVLARWTSQSETADFQGDFYEVNAYRLVKDADKTAFRAEPHVTDAFRDGYDGVLNGRRVTFPYKTASSIRARLAELGL